MSGMCSSACGVEYIYRGGYFCSTEEVALNPSKTHTCFCSMHFTAMGYHGLHGDRIRDLAYFPVLESAFGPAGGAK